MLKQNSLVSYRNLLIICCLSSIVVFLLYSFKWNSKLSGAFIDYYTYSRFVIDREDFKNVYDSTHYNLKIQSYNLGSIKGYSNQLPTNALAMLPLAWLKPTIAKTFWTVITILAYTLSIGILLYLQEIKPTDDIGLTLISFSLLWRPIYENIAWGQIYTVILLLFCIGLLTLTKKKQMLISLPIASSFLLKGYGIVPMIWLGATRHWRVLVYTILIVTFVVICTLPIFHASAWITYYDKVVVHLGRQPLDGHVYFQTINSLVIHLFTYDKVWLPNPLIVLPQYFSFLVSIILNMLLIVLVMRKSTLTAEKELYLSFSAAIATGVITAPLAAEYHYLLFLPLIIGLFSHTMKDYLKTLHLRPMQIVFVMSVIIMALPGGYKHWNVLHPPLILFAYTKLYAGIALIFYFLYVNKSPHLATT